MMGSVEIFGPSRCQRTAQCVRHFWSMGISPRTYHIDLDPWTCIIFEDRAPGFNPPVVFIAGKLIGDEVAIRDYDLHKVQQMIGGE